MPLKCAYAGGCKREQLFRTQQENLDGRSGHSFSSACGSFLASAGYRQVKAASIPGWICMGSLSCGKHTDSNKAQGVNCCEDYLCRKT